MMARPTDRACAPAGLSQQAVSAKGADPSRKPIVLVALGDPTHKPQLYACPKCGAIHSPRIYACNDELAHEAARQAATDCYTCRETNTCSYCGNDCPKGWTACSDCRLAKKLEAAEEVPDDGGPYFAFGGDTFYHELQDAAEDSLEWLSPCTVTYPQISADSVLENLLDDMHEDASTDDLDAAAAFCEAVDAFNKAQTTKSYWPDEKRKIRVPASGMSAGTAETAQQAQGEARQPDPQGDAPTSSPTPPEVSV